MKVVFGLVKVLTGFMLAIAILFLAGVAATRYMLAKLAIPPERPTFANDASSAPEASPSPETSSPTPSPSPSEPAPSPAASASPTPTNSPDADGTLARVNQPIGLILRQEPNRDARQITGLAYNSQVLVLEESSDGEWLRVRLPDSGVEGWVKSGNTEPVNE
jgi:cytoskeletal protein RodZ